MHVAIRKVNVPVRVCRIVPRPLLQQTELKVKLLLADQRRFDLANVQLVLALLVLQFQLGLTPGFLLLRVVSNSTGLNCSIWCRRIVGHYSSPSRRWRIHSDSDRVFAAIARRMISARSAFVTRTRTNVSFALFLGSFGRPIVMHISVVAKTRDGNAICRCLFGIQILKWRKDFHHYVTQHTLHWRKHSAQTFCVPERNGSRTVWIA